MRIPFSDSGVCEEDLGVVDRHALHGIGQVRLCSLLLLLLPSSLLLLSFLSGLLINGSRLDKPNYFCHTWKVQKHKHKPGVTDSELSIELTTL